MSRNIPINSFSSRPRSTESESSSALRSSASKTSVFRTKNSQPMGIRTVCGLALDYLSKMKIAVMVRQLDLGHILWCGRVVRVERAHRVRVVRSVQTATACPAKFDTAKRRNQECRSEKCR